MHVLPENKSLFAGIATFILVALLFVSMKADVAFAAEVLVDATTASDSRTNPSMVWINDQTGFIFYEDSGGGLSMASTTNGGVTWQAGRNVDSVNTTDVVEFAVWWDGWTPPGTTTQYIHIVTTDLGVDDMYYTRYDTTNNTLSTTVVGTTQAAACTDSASCYAAITKASDGTLYQATMDGQDSWVEKCSTTCTSTANWSEVTYPFNALGDDYPYLAPVAGTDDIMVLWIDVTADDIFARRYSPTTTSWGATTTLSLVAAENGTSYDSNLAGIANSTSTGKIAFTYINEANDFSIADHDIAFWTYSTTSGWVQGTDVITNDTGGITGAKIAFDELNDVWYSVYSRRTTITSSTTGNVYYRTSSNGGSTWSAESSALNTTSDDITSLSVNPTSFERIGVQWNYTNAPKANNLYYSDVADLGATPPATPAPVEEEVYFLGFLFPALRWKTIALS